MNASPVEVSVVVPVFNEERSLPRLFERLYAAMDALARSYEVVFVDDGSKDGSAELLAQQFARRPEQTCVVLLAANTGQHRAILAGFTHARGKVVVTLDADLQNPPEEIAKLLAKFDEGHDYVGSIRAHRHDRAWRGIASRLVNAVRERTTRITMTDHGCMLRAYGRGVVEAINQCGEMNTFIPALAYGFARNPAEVVVAHEARVAGQSKYSLYQLIRLNFDLMTGFSLVPLQLFSMAGMLISGFSGLLVIVLALRRLVIGPEEGGLFTLFGIAFFLIGIALFGIGLLGEYVGRIYEEVRRRPRYLVAQVFRPRDANAGV